LKILFYIFIKINLAQIQFRKVSPFEKLYFE
jgi:hypothetical protein